MSLTDLTLTQRKRLAKLAKTSDKYLNHLQSGRRHASAELAIRLERGAARMGIDLPREELCAACGKRELAKRAREV